MKEKILKPFDLEKAKQGAKVVTRNGRDVRIICWDKMDNSYPMYPIVALVKDEYRTEEDIETYTLDGVCVEGQKYDTDLFMSPTVVERWVNVHKAGDGYAYYHYNSKQEALKHKDDYSEYVTTKKISWEE